jgi:phosphoribosylglycinamide formyltransferase-1
VERLRFAVLVSGRGSNLQSILDSRRDGTIKGDIAAVISDKKNAFALERARKEEIPAYFINPADYPGKKEFEEEIMRIIHSLNVNYILLAGFMRVLSPGFIRGVGTPILNIHPSLLPSFTGLHAQRQAVEYGVRFSGCTVHFVDEGVDTGPIIVQAVVPVYDNDTEESLSERILQEEHKLYPKALRLLCEERLRLECRKVIIMEEEN